MMRIEKKDVLKKGIAKQESVKTPCGLSRRNNAAKR